MFAGKTTELLRRVREAAATGRRVAVFKPATDSRYSHQEVVAHTGHSMPAEPVRSARDIIGGSAGAEVVAIDEAHFFGFELVGVCAELLRQACRVIVAGLERDHHGRPFEPFPILLCEADEVVKLSGPCAVCGGPAVHSQRMVDAPGRIVVGGAGDYEARCRACFEPARDG